MRTTAAVCRWAAGFACLGALALGAATETAPTPESLCRAWFGDGARVAPLDPAHTNTPVWVVTRQDATLGWFFRTDRVPPVCKGKRGEIALGVAVGTDARFKGLRVLEHKEDPSYFRRLTDDFFNQFVHLRADERVTIDTVTRATYSSRAVIRDVQEGAREVLALPAVAAKLTPGLDPEARCRLTRTAPVAHNQTTQEQKEAL